METKTELAIRGVFSKSHEFEVLMDSGRCTVFEIQQWVRNRYAFQKAMVQKDLIVMYKCDSVEFRRTWIKRIIEADEPGGGLDSWVQLGIACGIDVHDQSLVYQETLDAIHTFLEWCHKSDWKIIVASSLSQLNAVKNHQNKLNTWYKLCPWIEPNGLKYFLLRIGQVSTDSQECLKFIENTQLPEDQLREATTVKRQLMKSILDGLYKHTSFITPV